MEQKQLDELDESYFGEEFLDDEEIKIEDVKLESKSKKNPKKIAKVTKSSKKENSSIELKSEKSETDFKKSPAVEVTEISHDEPLVKETIKETITKNSSFVDPIDPWADEEEESLFQGTSTWKAITGIAVILLILSVFTQGFQFSEEPTSVVGGISIENAEQKALTFVNDNLLQPPFVATVVKSEENNGVYKVTLSLAGETIDSFITKDGKFFFPQGFDMDVSVKDGATKKVDKKVEVEAVEPTKKPVEKTPTSTESVEVIIPDENPVEPVEVPVEVPVTKPVETLPVEATATQVSVGYKKWSFSPNKIQVKKGEKVQLTLSADDSNPSFVLFGLTFAIPELGVEQVVKGTSVIEFTADKTGSFTFTCASCTGTQAAVMQGTLVVE